MKQKNKELIEFKKQVREAVANYMSSEGCTCCQDFDAHRSHKEILGKLLRVPKYSDSSGRDFSRFQTNE